MGHLLELGAAPGAHGGADGCAVPAPGRHLLFRQLRQPAAVRQSQSATCLCAEAKTRGSVSLLSLLWLWESADAKNLPKSYSRDEECQ